MNHRTALKEARKRWGPSGLVLEQRGPPRTFVVGRKGGTQLHVAAESTKSWESAFAEADAKMAAVVEAKRKERDHG